LFLHIPLQNNYSCASQLCEVDHVRALAINSLPIEAGLVIFSTKPVNQLLDLLLVCDHGSSFRCGLRDCALAPDLGPVRAEECANISEPTTSIVLSECSEI